MLNRIICLQSLVEVITKQSSLAIDLFSAQSHQMRTMIYQNRLALDYLLAEEGGVCGKFNSSECCVEIDDHSEAIKNITTNIRKLAHVPVQRWTPMFKSNWWDALFNGEWWKKALLIVGIALTSVIFLPCIISCLIRLIMTIVQNSIEKLSDEKIEQIKLVRLKEQQKNPETAEKVHKKYQHLQKMYQMYEEMV